MVCTSPIINNKPVSTIIRGIACWPVSSNVKESASLFARHSIFKVVFVRLGVLKYKLLKCVSVIQAEKTRACLVRSL